MKNSLWVRGFIALLAVLFLVGATYGTLTYLNARQPITFGYGPEPATSSYLFFGRFVGLVAATFGGIVGSYIFERVRNTAGPVDMRAVMRDMWTSSRFIMALVVSPMVFYSIYLLIGDLPQTMPDYYLAFQNGFGWERIINGLSPGRIPAPQEPPGPQAA